MANSKKNETPDGLMKSDGPSQHDLERLVDGELQDDEYRQVLARIDDSPDQWRRLAMAFLENQALSRELRTWVVAESPAGDFDRSRSSDQNCANVTTSAYEVTSTSVDGLRQKGSEGKSWPSMLAAATAGLVVGWTMFARGPLDEPLDGQVGGPSIGPRVSDATGSASMTPLSPEAQELADVPNTTWSGSRSHKTWEDPWDTDERPLIFVRGQRSTTDGSVSLPVYGQSESHARQPMQSAITGEMQERLSRAGKRVERRWHYRQLRLPTGESLVVPVEEVNVLPVRSRWIP